MSPLESEDPSECGCDAINPKGCSAVFCSKDAMTVDEYFAGQDGFDELGHLVLDVFMLTTADFRKRLRKTWCKWAGGKRRKPKKRNGPQARV